MEETTPREYCLRYIVVLVVVFDSPFNQDCLVLFGDVCGTAIEGEKHVAVLVGGFDQGCASPIVATIFNECDFCGDF